MEAVDQEPECRPNPGVVDIALLLCPLCTLLLSEPVTLTCGNTCCRTCLVKELRRKAQCPCCDKPCHTRAEDQPQNVMMAQIAKVAFPELLEQRLRETEAEKAHFQLSLPAFLYNVPVFPGQTLCLHFFEPRYKLMMRRIIDTSRRFAYVLPKPAEGRDNEFKSRIALVAHVCDAEFLSDGRVMVKTKLKGRYTIQDIRVEEGTQGLHYCQLKPFEDEPLLEEDGAAELKRLHAQAQELCHGFLGPFKGQLVEEYGEMPPDAVGLSMWMASFLPFYELDKLALVHSRCTLKRLRACLRCATSMEELASASARREEKSSSAGDHVEQQQEQQQQQHSPAEAMEEEEEEVEEDEAMEEEEEEVEEGDAEQAAAVRLTTAAASSSSSISYYSSSSSPAAAAAAATTTTEGGDGRDGGVGSSGDPPHSSATEIGISVSTGGEGSRG